MGNGVAGFIFSETLFDSEICDQVLSARRAFGIQIFCLFSQISRKYLNKYSYFILFKNSVRSEVDNTGTLGYLLIKQ